MGKRIKRCGLGVKRGSILMACRGFLAGDPLGEWGFAATFSLRNTSVRKKWRYFPYSPISPPSCPQITIVFRISIQEAINSCHRPLFF